MTDRKAAYWRSTEVGRLKFVTDVHYREMPPNVQRDYEPYLAPDAEQLQEWRNAARAASGGGGEWEPTPQQARYAGRMLQEALMLFDAPP